MKLLTFLNKKHILINFLNSKINFGDGILLEIIVKISFIEIEILKFVVFLSFATTIFN